MDKMMESPYDFLERKGLTKVYQPRRRYNLSIAELVEFLDEYAHQTLREDRNRKNRQAGNHRELHREEAGMSKVIS
jgi:hypothetical protein